MEAVTDFNITGRLAQFGRGGIMEDVSNRLMREFATCLSTRLADAPAPAPEPGAAASTPPPAPPPPAPEPLKGGSLFLSVLWERIKRLFGRG